MDLCKYKHMFGKEGEGIHAIRIFNVAIVDVVGTILGGLFIARIFSWNPYVVIICCFVVGVLIHRLFCVNTTVNKAIFGVV